MSPVVNKLPLSRNRLELVLDGEARDQLIKRREDGDTLDELVLYLGRLGVITNRESVRRYLATVED